MTLSRQKPMPRTPFKRSPSAKSNLNVRTDRKEAAEVGKVMRAMKSGKVPANAAERVWMAAVAAYGCIVCRQQGRGYVPCAVHHIVEGGRRVGHMSTIGLCDPGHHQNSPDLEQISRHPNKARFEAAYGSEYELLAATQAKLAKSEAASSVGHGATSEHDQEISNV